MHLNNAWVCKQSQSPKDPENKFFVTHSLSWSVKPNPEDEAIYSLNVFDMWLCIHFATELLISWICLIPGISSCSPRRYKYIFCILSNTQNSVNSKAIFEAYGHCRDGMDLYNYSQRTVHMTEIVY